MRMTVSDLVAEFARPLTDKGMLFGLLGFLLLFTLASAAGMFGIWLLLVTLPAWVRFLLHCTTARIDGRPVDPPGIETFNLIGDVWRYLPLVLIALAYLAVTGAGSVAGPVAAAAVALAALAVLPASIGLLALTHSPLEALDPRSIRHMLRMCGRSYFYIPLALVITSAALYALSALGLPNWVVQAGELYTLLLLFSLTGSVVAASGAADEVDIPAGVEAPVEEQTARLVRERTAVLNHAYGLASRGNSAGGLQHIEAYIASFSTYEARIDEFGWFFQKLLDWEDRNFALLFARDYLSELVRAGDRAPALKALARSYHEADGFRPHRDDVATLRAWAEAAHHDDLVRRLDA